MFGNLGNALVALVIVIAIISGVAALGQSNSDLFNIHRARAQAEQIQADTAWQEKLRQMELPYIQAERESQLKIMALKAAQDEQILVEQAEAELTRIRAEKAAHIARLQEEQRVQRERNNLRLATEANWMLAGTVLTTFAGLALILVLAAVLLKVLFRLAERVPATQAAVQTVQADPWRDPVFRRQQMELARRRERQDRQAHEPLPRERITTNGHGRRHPETLSLN